SFYFRENLSRATDYLRGKMYDLWDQMASHGKLLDTFQQSTNWMVSIGMPVYTAYANVVGDVLGGAYQKLGRDAAKAALSVPLAALHLDETIIVSLKNVNWGKILASIPKPTGVFTPLLNPLGNIGG